MNLQLVANAFPGQLETHKVQDWKIGDRVVCVRGVRMDLSAWIQNLRTMCPT